MCERERAILDVLSTQSLEEGGLVDADGRHVGREGSLTPAKAKALGNTVLKAVMEKC